MSANRSTDVLTMDVRDFFWLASRYCDNHNCENCEIVAYCITTMDLPKLDTLDDAVAALREWANDNSNDYKNMTVPDCPRCGNTAHIIKRVEPGEKDVFSVMCCVPLECGLGTSWYLTPKEALLEWDELINLRIEG